VQPAVAAAFLAPGLALGSFLNVVAARVPVGRSVISPRSSCVGCGMEIAWYDNVPVLSWALLGGRCRHCAVAISWRYPAVEVATALLIVACVWRFGVSLDALVAVVFCTALVTVSATDLEHRIVPNRIVVPAAAAVLAAQTVLHPSAEWTAGALGASSFLFAAALAYPSGMGMGDVKLALLLGAMLGQTVPVALLSGMIFALVPSIVLFARHGAKARKLAIPFAPFLALGGLLALFAGDPIFDWYLGFM
jgi:leader peptidase (prepilin peptidase) / N-methyltransferase